MRTEKNVGFLCVGRGLWGYVELLHESHFIGGTKMGYPHFIGGTKMGKGTPTTRTRVGLLGSLLDDMTRENLRVPDVKLGDFIT